MVKHGKHWSLVNLPAAEWERAEEQTRYQRFAALVCLYATQLKIRRISGLIDIPYLVGPIPLHPAQ